MSQRGDGRWPVGSAGHIAFVAATLSFEGNQELGANARAVATLPCSRGVWEDKGVTPTAPSTVYLVSEPVAASVCLPYLQTVLHVAGTQSVFFDG